MKFESAPEEKEPTKEIPKQETTVEDIEKEVVGVDSEKNRAERLVILRQKQIELKKVMEILDESFLREDKGEEHEKKKVNGAETSFYIKTKLLPEMVEWMKKRELEGKEASLLEFINEEELPEAALEIVMEEIEKYEANETPVKMGMEVMQEKREKCFDLRKTAHTILAEIGEIDPFLKDLKMRQLETEFLRRFDTFFERVQIKAELWASGVGVLEHLFTQFWDGQGVIDKMFAKLNKKRMGLMQHTFILKGLSHQVEKIVDLLDRSDDAKEVRHYGEELKKTMKLLVEWNNEYRRLHKDGEASPLNYHIQNAYKEIGEGTTYLDYLAIKEIYPDREGKRGYEGMYELNFELNEKKNDTCGVILNDVEDFFRDEVGSGRFSSDGNKYDPLLVKDRFNTQTGLRLSQPETKRFRNQAILKKINELVETRKVSQIKELVGSLKKELQQIHLECEGIAVLDRIILEAEVVKKEKSVAA